MKIKKNDTVKVIAGNAKGSEGKVLKVFPDNNRVIVEKVNMIKRHMKQTSQADQGGIVEKEASISASNIILICPKCSKQTRTTHSILADGRKVRRCKKCNETLSDED